MKSSKGLVWLIAYLLYALVILLFLWMVLCLATADKKTWNELDAAVFAGIARTELILITCAMIVSVVGTQLDVGWKSIFRNWPLFRTILLRHGLLYGVLGILYMFFYWGLRG